MVVSKSEKVFWPAVEVVESHHRVSKGFAGRGDIEFVGPFEFGGKWSGTLTSKDPHSHLIFLKSAEFSGSLMAEKITVEGQLNDVEIRAKIFHAKAGSQVLGRIHAEVIVVDEGAIIQGRFVGQSPPPKSK